MTDFRHVRRLHDHSGGTVPDFHRIHYSPLSLYEFSGTQTNIQYFVYCTPQAGKLQVGIFKFWPFWGDRRALRPPWKTSL